jgi:AcrR family transcriptional regulator
MNVISPAPRGRRRDPTLDDAILEAALTMLAEGGYRNVSIEGVAARACVGKATVYRRYPTKAALIVDALRERLCIVDHLPDTGDLRNDLIAIITPLVDRLRGPDGPMMIAFMAERFREPELAAEFDRSVVGRKREHVRTLLRAAVSRGELDASMDIDVVAEMMPAIVWYHALSHLPFDNNFPARIVDQLLGVRSVSPT